MNAQLPCSDRYRFESDLVDAFIKALARDCPWGRGRIATEFDYRSGRTDIVLCAESEGVITFEAKLAKWRRAMVQAYRNAIFSQEAYILLPRDTARTALRHRAEFERRQIGLVTISDGAVDILVRAPTLSPLMVGLHNVATEFVEAAEDGERARSGRRRAGDLCPA